ncbi:teneurin-3-like [Brachyhypopomus gauderio]|uniref:teneurin-3-like n=1 Tax=Brachyhypopomus gauderio TaxID=698409 RepID=UPI004041371F
MDVKERRPYCSLTKSRREKERHYTGSSGDSEDCRVHTQKSYSSSETLKAFDHDSSRLLYTSRIKEVVHRETEDYGRQGQNFNLRQLGICEPATRRGLAFCAEMGLPHRGYSTGAGSDVDIEHQGVMSPERAMRLWGRGVKSGRSSCLSSRSNSPLTLTDTEHENKSDSENGEWAFQLSVRVCEDPTPVPTNSPPPVCVAVVYRVGSGEGDTEKKHPEATTLESGVSGDRKQPGPGPWRRPTPAASCHAQTEKCDDGGSPVVEERKRLRVTDACERALPASD